LATKYKPFLFDRSFDEIDEARARRPHPANSDGEADPDRAEADEPETEEEDAEPEEPPAPTFSEEELETAKTAAYDEGRRDGLEAGRKEVQEDVDAQMADALEVLAERIAPLFEQQRHAHERASALMVTIARDIFERLMPAYVTRHGDEEVIGLVSASLSNLQDVGKLTVRVAEPVADPLRERLEATVRGSGFEGTLNVVGDPGMARGDAAIDWGTGGAERRYSEIWADIEGAVQRAVEGLEPQDDPAPTATDDAATEASEPAPEAEAGPGTEPGAESEMDDDPDGARPSEADGEEPDSER
jgi:flagellar assembly protein FliH